MAFARGKLHIWNFKKWIRFTVLMTTILIFIIQIQFAESLMIAAEIYNKNKWFPPPTNPPSTFCSEVTVFAQTAPDQFRRGNQF